MSVDQHQHAGGSGWQPQPEPPTQPRKRHWVRWTILSAVAAFALITVVSVIAGANSATDTTSTTATRSTGPATSSLNNEHPPAGDVKIHVSWNDDFRDDVLGVATFPVTITNHSSKMSDYIVTIEIVNREGDRLDQITVLATDVRPGQKVRETAYGSVDLSDRDIYREKLSPRLVRVERTAS